MKGAAFACGAARRSAGYAAASVAAASRASLLSYYAFLGDWAEADRDQSRELADFLAGREEREEDTDAA